MRLGCLIYVLLLLAGASASAQLRILPKEKVESVSNPRLSRDSSALAFDTRHIDAGTMNEDDAPKNFVYGFRNVSDRTIRIKRLVSTCSCASASADVLEVVPGAEAEISLLYNPKGHPGRFERKVFVYTEGEKDPAAVLRLTVAVENGADLSGEWPVQMGSIRLRRSEIGFSEGVKAVEKLRFINLSGKPLTLECDRIFLPDCLSFRTEPETVPDGKTGEIIISYDPSKGGWRPMMKLILKGLGVPPGRSSITVNMSSRTEQGI